jgi:hypothetical protein
VDVVVVVDVDVDVDEQTIERHEARRRNVSP